MHFVSTTETVFTNLENKKTNRGDRNIPTNKNIMPDNDFEN